MVQWLRLCASVAVGVWSLVRELRSHMPRNTARKKMIPLTSVVLWARVNQPLGKLLPYFRGKKDDCGWNECTVEEVRLSEIILWTGDIVDRSADYFKEGNEGKQDVGLSNTFIGKGKIEEGTGLSLGSGKINLEFVSEPEKFEIAFGYPSGISDLRLDIQAWGSGRGQGHRYRYLGSYQHIDEIESQGNWWDLSGREYR